MSTDKYQIAINRVQDLRRSNHGGSQIITHELPKIFDSPNKGSTTLLVDIQPSQVANVVIPHGSSSIFVFGGVQKAHKVGQYFDDPSPHDDQEVGIKSVNLLADVEGTKYHGSQGLRRQGQHHCRLG
jgi:hypothetical protein